LSSDAGGAAAGETVAARRRLPYAVAMLRWIALAFAGLIGPAMAADDARLTIDTDHGPQVFAVELATTPTQMERGLMFRRNLPLNAGMLFVYPDARSVAFWMKNTLIPLDMLFIAGDGKVSRIVERTVPLSETPISSVEEVRAVLEVNGGTATRLGIKPGDVVHDSALGNK
jgi:uncharacterized membrane protein (UPF0127 family)